MLMIINSFILGSLLSYLPDAGGDTDGFVGAGVIAAGDGSCVAGVAARRALVGVAARAELTGALKESATALGGFHSLAVTLNLNSLAFGFIFY